jgi:hypothetical protein
MLAKILDRTDHPEPTAEPRGDATCPVSESDCDEAEIVPGFTVGE